MGNSIVTPFLRLLRRSSGLRVTLLSNIVFDSDGLEAVLLSPRELLEGQTKTSPSARRNWLLGRLAAKAAAADLLDLPWSEVEILRGPDGPPKLEAPVLAPPQVQISISHTDGGAMAAAAFEPVGVDLEPLGRLISDRAWLWAFKPGERALAEMAGPVHSKRLAMWCAKEAAAKCRELGLLNHLSEFEVSGVDWPGKLLFVEGPGGGREPVVSAVEILEDDHFIAALALPATAAMDGKEG